MCDCVICEMCENRVLLYFVKNCVLEGCWSCFVFSVVLVCEEWILGFLWICVNLWFSGFGEWRPKLRSGF